MPSPSRRKSLATQAEKFRRLARFVIEHHFGSRPARISNKPGGLSNFVFEAKHREGDFIVRISPDKARLNAFIKEQWCEQVARKAGVPTARILETGASIIPFPYVIVQSVEGIEGTKHPDREKVLLELGRLAAKINSIKTKGFGETFDWSNNELSRNETLKDYLRGEYRYEERIETLERSRLCPKETIRSLKQIFRELVRLRAKPVLNHGDLRLKNAIADEKGKIKAIIDWEKATSNIAPHWEFSMALHDLGIDEKEKFIEGYGIKPKRLADIAPYYKAFNLLNYADAVQNTNPASLVRLKLRLGSVLDLYSLTK